MPVTPQAARRREAAVATARRAIESDRGHDVDAERIFIDYGFVFTGHTMRVVSS